MSILEKVKAENAASYAKLKALHETRHQELLAIARDRQSSAKQFGWSSVIIAVFSVLTSIAVAYITVKMSQ